RSRASGAVPVGERGERAGLVRAARARRERAPFRRFRARARALQPKMRRPLMDTLHTVMRNLRTEQKRRDHLAVFREFLGHLDRIGKRRGTGGKSRNRGTKKR